MFYQGWRYGELVLVYAGPLPETDDEAWDSAIKKWEYLAGNPIHDGGAESCGLCMRCEGECAECLVFQATGDSCITHYKNYAEFPSRSTAQEMLDFLKEARKGTR